MDKVRFGIIGCGNIATTHSKIFMKGAIENGVLTAVCDVNPAKIEKIKTIPGMESVATFNTYKEMFESGLVDAVIIGVPHYIHPKLTIEALRAGLHVISEKPAGVYTKQVKTAIAESKKHDKLFGMMFNQRTNHVYRKVKELVDSGEYGQIRRAIWIITDWYRPQCYYDSGDWRATWSGEGGGVLINQCPHQLDLWQWIENRVFPIACDMFGNEFLISIDEANYGSVYFADHEKGYKKSLVGADLKEFIAKCKSKKIPPDTKLSIEEREADLISRGRGHVIDDLLRQMWQEEIDTYGNMIQEKLVVED